MQRQGAAHLASYTTASLGHSLPPRLAYTQVHIAVIYIFLSLGFGMIDIYVEIQISYQSYHLVGLLTSGTAALFQQKKENSCSFFPRVLQLSWRQLSRQLQQQLLLLQLPGFDNHR